MVVTSSTERVDAAELTAEKDVKVIRRMAASEINDSRSGFEG